MIGDSSTIGGFGPTGAAPVYQVSILFFVLKKKQQQQQQQQLIFLYF